MSSLDPPMHAAEMSRLFYKASAQRVRAYGLPLIARAEMVCGYRCVGIAHFRSGAGGSCGAVLLAIIVISTDGKTRAAPSAALRPMPLR